MARIIVVGGGVVGTVRVAAARRRRPRRDGARARSRAAARSDAGVGRLGTPRRQPVPHDPLLRAALSRHRRSRSSPTSSRRSRPPARCASIRCATLPARSPAATATATRSSRSVDRAPARRGSRDRVRRREARSRRRAARRCRHRTVDRRRTAQRHSERRRRAHRRRRGAAAPTSWSTAAGRRSTLPKLLTDDRRAGARGEDRGLRLRVLRPPLPFGRRLDAARCSARCCMPYGTVSTLTLPADNGTWGLGIIVSAKDKPMRAAEGRRRWMRVCQGFPLVAHWLDGEPLDDERRGHGEDRGPAPAFVDRRRAASPPACSRSPTRGRARTRRSGAGMSIGDDARGRAARPLARRAPDDPVELARAWHEVTDGDRRAVGTAARSTSTASRLAEIDAADRRRRATSPTTGVRDDAGA